MNAILNNLSSFAMQLGTQNDNTMQQAPRGYASQAGGSSYAGGSPAYARSVATPTAAPYAAHQDVDTEISEREDLLDQHVAYYLKRHPEVHSRHSLNRIRPGVYNFDGREISVEWHYPEDPDEQGYLFCIDGPLRQPFSDYMENSETGIEYDNRRLRNSALSQVQKGERLSFGDSSRLYGRLEAMQVAKEQALVREKAAEFQKDGIEVPQDELMSKYKKVLGQKLGERRQRRPEAEPVPRAIGCPPPVQAPAPAPVPVARLPAPPPQQAPAASPAPSQSPSGSEEAARTHGNPKYCDKHDRTEKRKKTKPHNESCRKCAAVTQTNYVEFTLCPACSEKEHRCMCCGDAAVGPSPKAIGPAPSQSPSGSEKAACTHGNPKYCDKHDRTEKRQKTKPHSEACRKCAAVTQTNYAEFTLCPTCSEKEHRCMCCGYAAVGASPKATGFQGQAQQAPSSPMNAQYSPQRPQSMSPQQMSPQQMSPQRPQLSLQQMSPMKLFGIPELLSCSSPRAAQANVYNPMASQNMYASQNAFASQNAYNPMASQNMMVMRQF